MDHTTNLNLNKPALSDARDITKINDNMDILDAAVAARALKTEAIKNITRSGTTYTATRCDNTTFTFTERGNSDIVNLIYPVGSIYMSVNSTSPASLFGGTWVQLKDRFLIGAGDSHANGSTGGAESKSYTPAGTVGNTTLTIDQIPSHDHVLDIDSRGQKEIGGPAYWGYKISASNEGKTRKTGGGKAHNHSFAGSAANINVMPPYLAVYMWKRTA